MFLVPAKKVWFPTHIWHNHWRGITIEHTLNIIPNSHQMLGSNLSFQGTAARDVAEFRFPCVHFACMRFACADLCGPKCCGILGREQTGTLVCILRVFVLRVQTSAARNVAESGGGSKPERLCAFCVYAFCVCRPLRPEMLRNRGAGVNRNACVLAIYARWRFARSWRTLSAYTYGSSRTKRW